MQMDQNEVVFVINQKEKIVLRTAVNLEDVCSFTDTIVTYVNDNGLEYILFEHDVLRQAVEELFYHIQDLFGGKMAIHASIYDHNIGYLWNENLYYRDHEGLEYLISDEGRKYWVGQKFLLWESRNFASWFYQKDSKAFLEITPEYRWHFDYPKLKEIFQYTTYRTFKKNYKSILLIELDEQVLREWREQLRQLINLIAWGDKMYFAPDKEAYEEARRQALENQKNMNR
jgi:hypothetical protein